MVRSATTSEQLKTLTTGVRLDLPTRIDGQLDEWAEMSRRSKKEHATFIVEEVIECYAREPMILHLLGLLKSWRAKIVAAHAGDN